ncbi:hypothetical protein G7Y79_00030g064260 [Physcia stellaris]|nr:hypothetical protein G7Y79_00030g064260 [Physcia stellaris]
MNIVMSDTTLPPTALLMNAVELSARYAQLDFLGRTPQRSGIVLPQFPQVEIAVVPAAHSRSIEVRLIIYTIYATMLDMIYFKRFYESEVEISWEGRIKGYVYFTPSENAAFRPNLQPQNPNSSTPDSTPHLQNQKLNSAPQPVNANFDWAPIYKPGGENIAPNDVFLLALGAIKVVAPFPTTDKVPGPFHIGSAGVNANLQIIMQHGRMPRPVPPFFRYSHIVEAVRRIPGWMLGRRRFAEFFCSVEVGGRSVGVLLMEKGPFNPDLEEGGGCLLLELLAAGWALYDCVLKIRLTGRDFLSAIGMRARSAIIVLEDCLYNSLRVILFD